MLEDDDTAFGQFFRDRVQVPQEERQLSLWPPVSSASEQNHRGFRSAEGGEHLAVARRLHADITHVNGVMAGRAQAGRNARRDRVVNEELQEATRSGSSLSRTLSAAKCRDCSMSSGYRSG